MFYGREDELEELNSRYSVDGFQFIPIYGRRRVGKTALIDEFIRDKVAVKFTAVKGSLNTNLRLFSSIVLGVKNAPVMNFEDALEVMHSRYGDGRYVLVIDEFPYLVKSDESVTGILNNFIESHSDSNVFIILSGSSMNIMNSHVLGKQSPLYGRRTGQIGLKPFTFDRISAFLPRYTNEERMIVYGLVGGIPWYLSFFDNDKGLKENIIDNLINPYAVLNKESTLLFAEEFEAPVTYFDILSSIAKGHNRVGEISSDIGLETSRVSLLLKGLVLLDIIVKVRPIDDPDSKRTFYRIKDHYLRSYFRFMYPGNVEVSRSQYDIVYEDIMRSMPEYLGHVFEDVCSEYLARDYRAVGTWWGTDVSKRTMEEVDIVALGQDHILACECKYRSGTTGQDVLETLIRRADLIRIDKPRRYCAFSKMGFTDAAITFAGMHDIRLLSLDDVLGDIPSRS